MTDAEERMRRALDAQQAPEQLRLRTLAAIEEARAREEGEGPDARQARSVASGPAAPAASAAVRAAARRRRPARALAALAACLVLALAGFGLYSVYREPVAFVGIDVNPSIELSVNRLDVVVEARALNDDGRAVLDAVALEGRGYRDALDALAVSAAFAPYADEGSLVEVNVASADRERADRLSAETDAILAVLPCEHACESVDEEVRDRANAAGMGMARYRAAEELGALDPSVTLEECAGMTMRELRDRIDACEGGDVAGAPGAGGQGASSGGGRGQGSGRHAGTEAGEGTGSQGQGSAKGHGYGQHAN